MTIGNSYVFIGENVSEEHFKNFTFGKKYTIVGITSMPCPDLGTHRVVLFDKSKYGCLEIKFNKYFKSVDEIRQTKIKNIIK